MFDLSLKTARVMSVDDPDKQGKIQISIEPEFKDMKTNLLPWAIPMISNTSNSSIENHPPKVDSKIWILVDKYYKRFYYISNRYFYNLFDFSKVSGLLDKCEKINKDYKNIDFKYYIDGTLVFHNNSDGSSGMITKHGTLIYVNENGDLIKKIEGNSESTINKDNTENISGKHTVNVDGNCSINCKKRYELESSGNLEISSKSEMSFASKTNGLVKIGNTVNTLGSILSELCQDLSVLTTTGSAGVSTSPTLTSQMTVLLSKIKMTFK